MGPSALVAGLNNYLTSAAGEVVESLQLSAVVTVNEIVGLFCREYLQLKDSPSYFNGLFPVLGSSRRKKFTWS